jgi:two-component system NtrC family sensor kinase
MTATPDNAAADSQQIIAELQCKLDERTAERNESIARQAATAEILRVIASSPSDVQPVFDVIVERAVRLCGAHMGRVYRYDGNLIQMVGWHGLSVPARNMAEQPFPRPAADDTLVGRVMLSRQPHILADLNEDKTVPALARQMIEAIGARSQVTMPMLLSGEPIGAITLSWTEPRGYSDQQITLLQTFADQAVIAIENVRLFSEVQERTRELSASLDDLRAAQDRLVQTEKLASLGQLTAGIAHEIKNPLNFVNNFSALSAELVGEMNDVLAEATLDKNTRGELDELAQMLKTNLEKVVQHGKRADSIVKNMLLHSREGSGEHRPVDINAIVDESLNLAYHGARAEKAGFKITVQRIFDPAVGMTDAYPQEITRVLLNLISNGFYATTKRRIEAGDGFEPTLSAATKNLGDKVEIRIRDNGTGIPAEVKEKIFHPFFTTKPAGEGTGLGLSMSHDIIVKQHGGTIEVDTEFGQFTEFKIVLPRTSRR